MSTIYIHWPFCLSKCYYCDFNSVKCSEHIDFKSWINLYKKVLKRFKENFYKNENITSIYFGGGTPSLLPEWFVKEFIEEISNNFNLIQAAEITLEVNPKTVTKQKLLNFKKGGINRLSIGVQSIRDNDLKLFGRIHNAKSATECVFEALDVFDNLSIDMIYNRPGQNLADWENELTEVLSWPINHVSLYELIIEDNTRLKQMIEEGSVPYPDSTDRFFEKTIEIAEQAGFEMYEVSNFAKFQMYGEHNLSYWNYEDYYGIGPGSHSRVTIGNEKIAIAQISNNSEWLNWAENPEFEIETLSEDEVFEEVCIMGLRSKSGLNFDNISKKIKIKYDLQNKIEKLMKNSYIIKRGNRIVLTKEGIKRLNLVIEFLVKEGPYENFN